MCAGTAQLHTQCAAHKSKRSRAALMGTCWCAHAHPYANVRVACVHCCRAGDLAQDQRQVVPESVRLLQAVVDVVASSGWLSPALVAMEMSQMVVQVGNMRGHVCRHVFACARMAACVGG